MMARRGVMGLLAGAAGILALGGCGLLNSTYSYRYKITIEVDTPEGLKTGFAVREISYTKQWIRLPDMAGVVATQRGEAVAVDLPGGQALFALLSTNGYETLQAAFGNDAPETLDKAKSDRRIVDLKPMLDSIPEQSGYPILVTFSDIADPSSVKLVDPADLATNYGPGVRLKRITVEITDDPVSTGIVKRLGWLPSYYSTLLSGERYEKVSQHLADHLGAGNFSTELSK